MKNLVLSIVTVSTLSTAAFAETGGNGSGGGNTVNANVLSEYIQPINQIAGYKEVVYPTLVEVTAKLPSFGKFLSYISERLTIYVIPRKLKGIPGEITGIPFDSDQTALHLATTGEVFIDASLFAKLANNRQRGLLLLQEILEQPLLLECYSNARIDGTQALITPDKDRFASCSRHTMAMIRKSIPLLVNSKSMTSKELKQRLIELGWYSGPVLQVPGVSELFP